MRKPVDDQDCIFFVNKFMDEGNSLNGYLSVLKKLLKVYNDNSADCRHGSIFNFAIFSIFSDFVRCTGSMVAHSDGYERQRRHRLDGQQPIKRTRH